MKRLPFLLLALASLVTAPVLRAQWFTKSYALASGWNGIWLPGDASYTTVGELFQSNTLVTEVWRWNPNPDQIQFSATPSAPTTSSEEWTVWKRNDPAEQQLTRMVANSAYLIRTTAATTVAIKQKVQPPSATWLISGANFIGFPSNGTGSTAPYLSNYFASFINGSTTGLPSTAKVYKYVGGELSSVSPTNPFQIVPTTERLESDKAYWFNLAAVSSFTGPLDYELPGTSGLAFGRTLSTMTVGVTNRTTSALTLTISLDASESAPTGQPGVTGSVPLTRRVFNSTTNVYDETAITGSFTVSVPASGRVNLDFGINRAALTGDSSAFYASLLRLRDSGNFTDVRLPVSAQTATTAGLWLCQVNVNSVASTQSGSGTSTSRPFPLLFIAHMDANGTPRLLRQVFLGRLVTTSNPLGLSIYEGRVLSYASSDMKPVRYYAPIMPANQGTITGTGSFATGSTTTWTISHAYNDPVNPFVHTYHPDHDNLDARFASAVSAGVESYTVNRTCLFSFTATPPDGSTIAGWGTTVIGGTYAETLTGLNKVPLQVGGTFAMRRVSEIADLDTTSP